MTVGKAKDPKQNAFRNADRFVRKWGLRWNIPFSYYQYDKDTRVPYLAPRDIMSYLMRKSPELLMGGIADKKMAQQLLRDFWSNYREYHPQHDIYIHLADYVSNTVPVLWHGDEGRGVRKGNTTVCSLESPFGLDTCNADCYNTFACCPQTQSDDWSSRQNYNHKFHSFLTKFIMFALPRKLYQETTIIDDMCKLISLQLRSLFFEGLFIDGKLWHFACVGLKGDLAWFSKIAKLQRCYLKLSNSFAMMCHECHAGTRELPWEEVLSDKPAWSTTLYASRPWTSAPSTGLTQIPYDALKPEKMLKRDLFHNTKVGVFQDYVGSCMLLIAELGYFNMPGD